MLNGDWSNISHFPTESVLIYDPKKGLIIFKAALKRHYTTLFSFYQRRKKQKLFNKLKWQEYQK